jgi:hypothetical protein
MKTRKVRWGDGPKMNARVKLRVLGCVIRVELDHQPVFECTCLDTEQVAIYLTNIRAVLYPAEHKKCRDFFKRDMVLVTLRGFRGWCDPDGRVTHLTQVEPVRI